MSDIVERAEERLSVSRLGKSSHRETDKDLVVIADLLAELDQANAGRDMWARTADALGGNMEDVGHILSGVRYDEAEDVYRAANRVVAERDAALATLAEVRAEHQPKTEPCCDCSKLCDVCAKECASCEQQSPCDTIHILDRSTP